MFFHRFFEVSQDQIMNQYQLIFGYQIKSTLLDVLQCFVLCSLKPCASFITFGFQVSSFWFWVIKFVIKLNFCTPGFIIYDGTGALLGPFCSKKTDLKLLDLKLL